MTLRRSEPSFYLSVQREGDTSETQIDARHHVESLEYISEESKADLVKFTVQNWELKNFDVELWKPGNIVTCGWGYPGNMTQPRKATITKVSGSTALTVEAQGDESAKMNRLTKTRSFTNMTRAQVAAEIAREHGWEPQAQYIEDTEVTEEVITQARETDAQFLRRLSRIEGFEFYTDVDGMYFQQRQLNQTPVKVLRWYSAFKLGEKGQVGDIIDWGVESGIFDKPGKKPGRITAKSRDPVTKRPIVVESADRLTKRIRLGAETLVVDVETGKVSLESNLAAEDVRPTSQTSQLAAQREADGAYRKAQMGVVELSMKIVGDPQVFSKQIIEVSNISKRLSGKYFIAIAAHKVNSSGFVVDMKLMSDGAGGYTDQKSAAAKAKADASKAEQNLRKGVNAVFDKYAPPALAPTFLPNGDVNWKGVGWTQDPPTFTPTSTPAKK